MKLQSAVQNAIVGLLCMDDRAAAELSMMVEPEDLDLGYREVAEVALAHRQRWGSVLGKSTRVALEDLARQDENMVQAYANIYSYIQSELGSVGVEYVLDKARAFVRYQRFRKAASDAIRGLGKNNEEGVDEAEAAFTRALQTTVNAFDPGVVFGVDEEKTLEFLTRKESPLMKIGIPALDEANIGPMESRLMILNAASGRGKSWFLIHLAVQALRQGVPVAYIALEMTETEVTARLMQCLMNAPKRPGTGGELRKFDKTTSPEDVGSVLLSSGPASNISLYGNQDKVVDEVRKWRDESRLVIKEFAQGTLTPQQLDAYLTVLSDRTNFMPRLLLVDYGDIMRLPSGMDRWQALIQNTEALRRIAQERKIAVVTVSQVKHEGANAEEVDVEHTAGAWDKVATADTILTLSQTKSEREDQRARIFVAKNRADADRFRVAITQNYATGQFVVDSVKLDNDSTYDANSRAAI